MAEVLGLVVDSVFAEEHGGLRFGIRDTFLQFFDVVHEQRPIASHRSRSGPPFSSELRALHFPWLWIPNGEDLAGDREMGKTPAVSSRDERQRMQDDAEDSFPVSSSWQVPEMHGHGGPSSSSSSSTALMPDVGQSIRHSADEEMDGLLSGDAEYFTVMMKNIPCACTRQEVLNAIEQVGFQTAFDFFYLPIRNHKENLGYAFVGFPDPSTTRQFAQAMTGFRFTSRKRSPKVISVVPARIQGLTNCREHLQKNRIKPKWSPIFSIDPAKQLQPGLQK